jgi:hypothetical protein
MRKILFWVLLAFSCNSFAQDIEVKKFEVNVKDQTAALNPRKDINGVTCGLVKVLLKEPGAEFEGNVMGDVQFTGKEYLVYLPNGTKRLGIKHQDYLPTTIVFSDYGTKRVSSGTTYELWVKVVKKKPQIDNSKKGVAVFNIIPSNSTLLIDGQVTDSSNGLHTLSLPYGLHHYTVKHGNISLNNQCLEIGKGVREVNVDLTSFYAKLKITCSLKDTKIFINGEYNGDDNWIGSIMPGVIEIKAIKDGYSPIIHTINLSENDSLSIDISNYSKMTGSLYVNYQPEGCEIYLDGQKVGETSFHTDSVSVGKHTLRISKEFFKDVIVDFIIEKGQDRYVSGELFYSNLLAEISYKAEKNDAESQYILACCYEGEPYYTKKIGFVGKVELNKSFIWLKKSAELGFVKSMRKLAEYYYYGKGCIKDREKSLFWYKKSVDIEPDSRACYMIGVHYRYGLGGVEKDYKTAAFWYRIAAKAFYKDAEMELKEIGYTIE